MNLLTDSDLTEMGIQPKSRAQRWRNIRAGTFPKPIKMGSRNVWPEEEIEAWVEARKAERDSTK